jgi:hypothetical protein
MKNGLKYLKRNNMEKETIEEAAKEKYGSNYSSVDSVAAFIEGAKSDASRDYWHNQFKKSHYSEEDMKLSFEAGHKKGFSGYPNTENWKELSFNEWFENFKKK